MINSLALRITLFLTVTSFAIAYLASEVFYRQSYSQAIEQSNSEISTLIAAVTPTASIAAFVEDKELVIEVLNGLMESQKVKAVAFKSDKINEFKNVNLVPNQSPRIFIVTNPFIKEEAIAELQIYPNLAYIEQQAEDLSKLVTTALYILALCVTVSSSVICFFVINRPLTQVSRSLNDVVPGSQHKIPLPTNHSNTEIGKLVFNTNQLLSRIFLQFKEERRLRKEIEKLEQQFRLLFENATSPIILIDGKGEVIIQNNSFNKLIEEIGFPKNNKLGYLLSNLLEIPKTMDMAVHEAVKHNETVTSELKLKNFSDDQERWVQLILSPFESDSEDIYYHITLNDISRRKRELSNLAQQADYDSLTKILNRNGGEKELRKLVMAQQEFALVLIDLNGFKPINDEFGHDAGDVVLVKTAELISGLIRDGDKVVRWGGDEFIILLRVNKKQAVKRAMAKVASKVVRDYQFANHPERAHLSISAGVAMFPKDSADIHGLIRAADEAMYEAKRFKESNPDKYLIFSDDLKARSSSPTTTA